MSAWTPPPPGRHVYEYPRPAVAVDCVVLGLDTDDLKVLLIGGSVGGGESQAPKILSITALSASVSC